MTKAYDIHQLYHGFRLDDQYDIPEVDGRARVFTHVKSGTRLLHLETDDDNKVFSAAFKTPPTDSTGVPHIVEHCVLSGSRKYHTKEPFMDMVKGSLQTFINAMTFSDKTIYPVASRNDKDFHNLMDVYLDSVFYPKIYTVPDIFMQEGWHYDIHDPEAPLQYTGVVYNEMKGAYSNPKAYLNDEISRLLFPDTCYQYSSGGDPDVIPELTYEAFLDFHKKHYHPSNCFLYLYGDMDLDEKLDYLNAEYLSAFDAADGHAAEELSIQTQQALDGLVEGTCQYPVADDAKTENRDFLALGFVTGETADPMDNLISSILKNVLVSSSAGPVKQALLEAGIGEDIQISGSDGKQRALTFIAKHARADQKDAFRRVIMDTLKKLVRDGLDRELVRSSINLAEFSLREATGFPTKGIIYHIHSLESWLYTDHPTALLSYNDVLKRLREGVDTGFFEQYIEDRLLNNPHQALVVMTPEKGLNQRKDKAVRQVLDAKKASLSATEIETLIERNKALEQKQLFPDSPEALATIPKLAVEDVDPKAMEIPQEEIDLPNGKLLFHDIFSSGITYVDMNFDISMITAEEIPYVNLLAYLLGRLDTRTYSYADLSNEINLSTGGITFSTQVLNKLGDTAMVFPQFSMNTKVLRPKIDRLMELLQIVMTETRFEDTKRIHTLIQQQKSKLDNYLTQSGNAVASRRVASYFSPASAYAEKMYGLEYYWFISDLANTFDEKADDVVATLNTVYGKVFNTTGMLLGITGEREDANRIQEALPALTDHLLHVPFDKATILFEPMKKNEGITAASGVQYVAKGADYMADGFTYTGAMRVLESLMNSEYLHDRVRAKGGAYGCSMTFNRSGRVSLASYRDPNLSATLDVYDEAADFIAQLDMDQEALTKFIIGAIARLDSAMTPKQQGQLALSAYVTGFTQELKQAERDDILHTTPADIRALAPIVRAAMEQQYYCVLGNDQKIKEAKALFGTIRPLNP